MKRSLAIGIPAIAAVLLGTAAFQGSRLVSSERSAVRTSFPTETVPSTPPERPPVSRRSEVPSLLGISKTLSLSDVATDIRRIALLAKDPALVPSLRALAETWSSDPELRLRAELIWAYLDRAWVDCIRAHPNPEIRRELLRHPPDSDEGTTEALLLTLESDFDSSIRLAAAQGLPTALNPEGVRRISARVRLDPDSSVRVHLIEILGTLRTDQPEAIQELQRRAFAAPDPEERHAALSALLRCSNEHPALLTSEESEAVHQALLSLPTSR